jgi:hypothetical protein
MHDEQRKDVKAWLEKHAGLRGYTVHWHLCQEKEPWLYVPVSVNGGEDAYGVAEALQKLEDAWNRPPRKPRPYWKLLLLPAPPDQTLDRPASVASLGER